MTRRRCRSCGGNKIVLKCLEARVAYPALCPFDEPAWVVCRGCGASGFQEGKRDWKDGTWRWRPAPQEHIVL